MILRVGQVGKGQVMAIWLIAAILLAIAIGIWLWSTYPR